MSIVAAFDGAAQSYDGAAQLQRDVGARLMGEITVSVPRTILDIGCGTGIVTAMAQQRWPDAKIAGIDAAPAMLKAARAKLPSVRFVEADAASMSSTEQYDLIISSMVLHWLPNPDLVLKNWQSLLAPGGALHVAVPVAGSLPEWKALCAKSDIAHRLWPFPSPEEFDRAVLERHTIAHPSVRDFLCSMKQTGAASGAPATVPASPASLRRLLASAKGPFTATFIVAHLAYTKTGPHRCEPASS